MTLDLDQLARTYTQDAIIGDSAVTVRMSFNTRDSLPNRRLYLGWVALEDAAPDAINQPAVAEGTWTFRKQRNEVGRLAWGGITNEALLASVNLSSLGLGQNVNQGWPPFEIYGTGVAATRPTSIGPNAIIHPVHFAAISAMTPIYLVALPVSVRSACDEIDLEARFYFETALDTSFRVFAAQHSFA